MTEIIKAKNKILLSSFEKLAKINVNEHAEKKGKFTYLSWAWAVDVLRKAEPSATWEVIRFNGLPFLKTEAGFFVEVSVTVQGITLAQLHPVLDNNNKPITTPNAFQINTSIQRCLVKAIALHGLGLYIYAGEDLPEGETTVEPEIKSIDSEQGIEIEKLAKKKGVDLAKICKAYEIHSIIDLPSNKFEKVINTLQKKPDFVSTQDEVKNANN
jgi:hypothetical protein